MVVGVKKEGDGKGIEDFVGDEGSEGSADFGGRVNHGGALAEAGSKSGLAMDQRFDHEIADGPSKIGIESGHAVKDIEGERAVVGPGFDHEEGGGRSLGPPKLVEAVGQERSEDRPDRNARHEVAVLGDRAGLRAGVIPQFGMVKAAVHVVRERQGAFFPDFRDEETT